MIQFYCPDIEHDPVLPESDSQHCVRVLRMQPGDELQAVDGKGHVFTCRLADPHPKHAMVEIVSKADHPLPWPQSITVAVAPTKMMDRMEWMVEKLVEVGVNRIIPIRCRHSERKEIKEERLRKIAVAAMKQSLKAVLPEITPMATYEEALKTIDASQKFIAYCDPSIPRRDLCSLYRPCESAAILIGPEGDFSQPEIAIALDAGYSPVTLGDNRLRTETAAVYACSAFHVIDSLKKS